MRGLRVVLALVLGFSVIGVVPAQASGGGGPLPGYTISNPPLAPAVVGGKPARVLQGVHSHAGYVIEVPPKWNGKLAMWAHGYRGQGTVLTIDPPAYGLRQQLLDQGYAWAASSYATNGYDVASGVTTTRELATLFGKLVQRPKQVFIAGVSMGGHVIGRSLEEYPGFYAGALPMCGVLGDHELFDTFLDFNVVAQDLADVPAYPPPADYLTNAVPKIQQALGLTELKPGGPDTLTAKGAQLRAITVNQTGGARPGADTAFAYWKDFLFSLGVPSVGDSLAQDPGQFATNLFTRYRPNTPGRGEPDGSARPGGEPARPAFTRVVGEPADLRPAIGAGAEPARTRGHVRAVLDGTGLPRRRRPARQDAAARAARDPDRGALRVRCVRSRDGLERSRAVGGQRTPTGR